MRYVKIFLSRVGAGIFIVVLALAPLHSARVPVMEQAADTAIPLNMLAPQLAVGSTNIIRDFKGRYQHPGLFSDSKIEFAGKEIPELYRTAIMSTIKNTSFIENSLRNIFGIPNPTAKYDFRVMKLEVENLVIPDAAENKMTYLVSVSFIRAPPKRFLLKMTFLSGNAAGTQSVSWKQWKQAWDWKKDLVRLSETEAKLFFTPGDFQVILVEDKQNGTTGSVVLSSEEYLEWENFLLSKNTMTLTVYHSAVTAYINWVFTVWRLTKGKQIPMSLGMENFCFPCNGKGGIWPFTILALHPEFGYRSVGYEQLIDEVYIHLSPDSEQTKKIVELELFNAFRKLFPKENGVSIVAEYKDAPEPVWAIEMSL